jgi:hypothetical protein
MFRNGLWNVAFPLCSHSCSLFPYQARESKKVLRDGAFFATRERVSKNSLDTERSPNWSEHDMSSTMFGLHWTVQTGCPFLNENWKTDPFIIILSQNYCLITTVCILVRYLRPARTTVFLRPFFLRKRCLLVSILYIEDPVVNRAAQFTNLPPQKSSMRKRDRCLDSIRITFFLNQIVYEFQNPSHKRVGAGTGT